MAHYRGTTVRRAELADSRRWRVSKMRSWMAVAALLLTAGAKGDVRVVHNHARVFSEPRYWARGVGEVDRGDKLTVLKQEGTWLKVQLKSRGVTGYVPQSAFVDAAVTEDMLSGYGDTEGAKTASATQAANASRGFSSQVHQADVDQGHLAEADAWIQKYEGTKTDTRLEKQLATNMPGFLADGHLAGGAP